MGNTVQLSPLLAELFPQGVVATNLHAPGDPALLFDEELDCIRGAVPKRIHEFAAGRLCARRALAELGITRYPLRINEDRSPQWPEGIVGSISHTEGFCGAVVAECRQFRALGLDVETVGHVTADIWPDICVPSELSYLMALAERQRSQCAALIFCVKEAFYKCQYGITRQWLDFDEVCLDLGDCNFTQGDIAVRTLVPLPQFHDEVVSMTCTFRFERDTVFAGAALIAS